MGVVSSSVFVDMFWLPVFLVSADGVSVFGPLCVCVPCDVYRVMCTYLLFKGFRVVSAFPYVGSHVCVTLCVAHVLVIL